MTFIIGLTVFSFLLGGCYFAELKRFKNGDHYLLQTHNPELRSKAQFYVGMNIKLSFYSLVVLFTLCCLAIALNLLLGETTKKLAINIGPFDLTVFLICATIVLNVLAFTCSNLLHKQFRRYSNMMTSVEKAHYFKKLTSIGNWSIGLLCVSQLSLFLMMILTLCL